MTLEEAIKHAEEVAATSCDECREEHEQLAAWPKELKEIKENSIIISNNRTAWQVVETLIDAVGRVKTWNGSCKIDNIFDVNEIANIGNHLMNYANVERTDDY